MVSKRSTKKSKSQAPQFLQKPNGVIHPRVQKIGPEHFGIVCVDCAKLRSKWMLTDFYGQVLVPPTEVAHNRVELDAAVAQVCLALEQHELRDSLVAVERTGRAEAQPLADRIVAARQRRKTGPQPLGELLARLGVGVLPLTPSGEKDLT